LKKTREQDVDRDVAFSPMEYIPGGEAGETRVRMSDATLDVGQLHVDQALTNVSVAYQNAAFVAEEVAPVVPVNMKSNKYWVYGMERFTRRMTSREPGDKPRESGWSLSTDAYFCQGHSWREWYPWEAPSNADPAIDLDIDSTETATDVVLLAQEMDLVDALVAGLTPVDLGTAGQQVDDPDVDPIAYFDKAKETVAKKIGRQPNTILFGRPAWRGFRNNPNVLKHIYGTTVLAPDKMITPEMATEKLEIPQIIIAEAMYNTATNESQATSLDYVWGNYILLFYKDPQPGRRKVSLAYHFLWNVGNAGRIVEKWYDQDRKRFVIDVSKYRDQKIVSAGAGTLFENTLQTP